MKASALSSANKWKDYVDLYFLIKHHFKLEYIVRQAKKIFGNEFNERIFREALSYFKDVDYSEEVSYMEGAQTSDRVIKEYLKKVSIS